MPPNANWWLPRWLDRLLPDVHIEGAEEDLAQLAGTGEPPA